MKKKTEIKRKRERSLLLAAGEERRKGIEVRIKMMRRIWKALMKMSAIVGKVIQKKKNIRNLFVFVFVSRERERFA